MPGTIEFKYDREHDLVIADARWSIESEEDVRVWYRQWVDYFEKNFPGRRMDMVVELSQFEIKPAVAAHWGEYRAKIHKQYTRHSDRVHSSSRVRLYVNTSGVRYDASTAEAASIEDGIAGILDARRGAAVAAG